MDRCVLFDVETEFEIAFSESVVSSFMFLYGVLQLCEGLMPVRNGREEGLQPGIEVEYGFLVERHDKKRKSDSRLKYAGCPDVIAISAQRKARSGLIALNSLTP